MYIFIYSYIGMILKLAQETDILVTVEEGSKGGFGDAVMDFLSNEGILDTGKLKYRTMVIPGIYICIYICMCIHI
jgi:1-deoxy-D-xylulose-5-phosphate synthase